MSQDRFTGLVTGLVTGFLSLVGCASGPRTPVPVTERSVRSVELGEGRRLHAFRTGWVQVKTAHFEMNGAESMRFPAILTDSEWTGWLPVIVYAVETRSGVVLVDTGPERAMADREYFDCDGNNDFFYRSNLRFEVPEGEALVERLAALEIDPAAVHSVLITHFHADHVGGITSLPRATVMTGEANWPTHVGSYRCKLPEGFAPRLVSGEFALDDTGLTAVPLPGHTPGHMGLRVEAEDGRRYLIVGDATFDADQTARGAVAGVSDDVEAARASQQYIQEATDLGDVILPAHDATVFERL